MSARPVEPRTAEDPQAPRAFGRYTLLRELGRGAMGVVHEARDEALGRVVALKVLRADTSDEEAMERFRREAAACAQVRHDHVVAIHDSGEIDGSPYYTMDYVPGRTLASLIHARETPPLADLLRGLAGVADALHMLHQAGLVHRDVKPSNILVRDSDGRMILTDFGLVRSRGPASLTQTGQLVGTPLYMSPEQVSDEYGRVDARSDVYGLGATLYEALCGQPIFPGEKLSVLAAQILRDRPAAPRGLAPEIPPDVERVVLKALEKRQDDRYASAASLRDDLLAFLAGRRVVGRPVSVGVRALRAAWRWRVALGLILVALAAGLFAWGRRPVDVRLETTPPGATAFVDGASRGATPLSVALAPGSYALKVHLDGYREWTRAIDARAGSDKTYDIQLVVADVRDTESINRIAQGSGIQLPRFPFPESERATSEGEAIELVVPQGDVRPEDLRLLLVDVDPERFAGGSTIELRRGTDVLFRGPFDPQTPRSETALPETVWKDLPVGESLTWGVWPPAGAGAAVTTTVRIADARVASLAEIEQRFAEQPAAVRQHLRLQRLLDVGLFSAAFLEAEALSATDASDVRAVAVMERALDRLSARSTRLASALRDELRTAPEPQRARVLAPP